MTTIQKITLVLLVAYGTWEVANWSWAKSEPGVVIRADLVFIYPVLALFILLSLIQFLRKKVFL